MGAAIAQQFVLDHPERVKSLILVSTFSHIDVHLHKAFIKLRKSLDRGGYSTFFDEVVKLAFNPDFVTANTHFMEEVKTMGIKINSPTAIAHATEACMKFNVKNRISQISVPTLIISGREDTFTPLALSEPSIYTKFTVEDSRRSGAQHIYRKARRPSTGRPGIPGTSLGVCLISAFI
jgi:3-oxoadipate enol-lactonase